jgi:hypothetical protein
MRGLNTLSKLRAGALSQYRAVFGAFERQTIGKKIFARRGDDF